MITNFESAIQLYESLTDEGKSRVLGRVCHQLTIAARWVYTEGTSEQQREKLIAINEIQHRALAQMLAYQENRKERYPDRDILLNLIERAKNSGLLGHLQQAIEKALSGIAQGTI
jgi:hypothetical protein